MHPVEIDGNRQAIARLDRREAIDEGAHPPPIAVMAEIGDVVRVVVARDEEEPTVEVPEDLSSALCAARLQDGFASLAYTHRREYVEWVTAAKRAETRANRVAKAVSVVRADKTPS